MDKFLTFQKVKAEHQRLIGELRPLEALAGKWDSISMDLVMGYPFLLQNKMPSGLLLVNLLNLPILCQCMILGV